MREFSQERTGIRFGKSTGMEINMSSNENTGTGVGIGTWEWEEWE